MLQFAVILVLIVALAGAVLFILIREQEHKSRARQYEKALQEDEAEKQEIAAKHAKELERTANDRLAKQAEHSRELERLKSDLAIELQQRENEAKARQLKYAREIERLESEISTLQKYRFIPDIIEKANRLKEEVTARIQSAERRASEIVNEAQREAVDLIAEARRTAETNIIQAGFEAEALIQNATRVKESRIAEAESNAQKTIEEAKRLIESAQKQADQLLKKTRAEVKEKSDKAEQTLTYATIEAQEIVAKAEKKAVETGGKAYEALKRAEFYEKTADAMFNVTKGYGSRFMVPPESILDAWAEEYGFHEVGQKLKVASDVVRIMEKNRTAAICEYVEANRRETAINFVVDAFRGKVDSIKSRIKKDNYGTLRKEIADAFALVNFNGRAFREARITDEYLDAILNELKWAAELHRLREADREEQRQIREKIREEEKAKRDYERAIKQAQRDEAMLKRAMEEVRKQYDTASLEERAKYEAKLQDLSAKLTEAEERNRRAMSMAQQTKQGHVYIISNIGSFGEDVYKIGLTRRLDPLDRVKELGDASVPFPFDVHAMIQSNDAPALEHALHKLHLKDQVNKVNPRKEFFRIPLTAIRKALEELKIDVKWTLAAEAREYRETLVIEESLKSDAEYQKRWLERQEQREIELEQEDELIEEGEALAYAGTEEAE